MHASWTSLNVLLYLEFEVNRSFNSGAETHAVLKPAARICWVTSKEMVSLVTVMHSDVRELISILQHFMARPTCAYWHLLLRRKGKKSHVKPYLHLWHFTTADHHQPAVETSGGAGAGEVAYQVKIKSGHLFRSRVWQHACPPISLTESFLHRLGRFDIQCAEMLLFSWWGFTLLSSGNARTSSTSTEKYVEQL